MTRISNEDYEFLFRLESLNNALTLSVTDPVVITEYIPGGDSVGELGTFWDCWENEDEAREIMKGRMSDAFRDIDKHIDLHRRMLNKFYSIQEAMNCQNRLRVSRETRGLCQEVSEYGDVVKDHRIRLKERAFLEYPRAQQGRLFALPVVNPRGGGRFAYLSFNPQVTKEGLEQELAIMGSLAFEFSSQARKIPSVQIGEYDPGEGISDCSFRGRLALTEELFRRVNE